MPIYDWILGITLYLIVGSVVSRSVGRDARKNPNGTSPGEDFFLVLSMLFYPFAIAYVVLVMMAGGKSSKKGKTDA